jgi:hypothetical protein
MVETQGNHLKDIHQIVQQVSNFYLNRPFISKRFKDDYLYLNAVRCNEKKNGEIRDKRIIDSFINDFQENYM